ncbi:GNAT family N-acetyltransferase [Sporosarcina ureilytica]|uniref:GNAT family N-acetyltransferase n=1 Tax=Sporosarcina ureilytica TaxID=298596 RepID=A0A1D8JID2_9BACL|nr:GNAT family N-acetyltransferase [Sporosarcina ureilytica]AOV08434.1 GNAT family N-acetyltransferase [Sporosarcina ureilytica]
MYNVTIVSSQQELEDAFFVRRKVFVEEQGVPLSLELDEFDDTASHFVVYKGDSPIGAGRIRETSARIGKVERVCVLPKYRGLHLGKLIMQALENHGSQQGYEKIVLNAQSYAIPFYENIGYTITSPEFMDADIPHRAMEKIIKN